MGRIGLSKGDKDRHLFFLLERVAQYRAWNVPFLLSVARYLGYHTRQLGDYSWPEAVTHLATHAARRFRLTDRGLIRPGFVADIAVLDPASVTDRSTYAAGRTLAEGVEHVLVNGTLALENGEPTGATPGRALRRG